MKVRREMMISNLEEMRKRLSQWIKILKEPPTEAEVQVGTDGLGAQTEVRELYPGGKVPKDISVEDLHGVRVDQLQAEMLALSAMLEGLVSAP